MEFWSIMAAVFAALTFTTWVIDNRMDWRHRPRPFLEIDSGWTATFDDDSLDGLTVTNTGTGDALFIKGIILRGGGDNSQREGFMQPVVLRSGDHARLLFTHIDMNNSYIVYVLRDRYRGRTLAAKIEWQPVDLRGPLYAVISKQFNERDGRPPRWVSGPPTPRFVGPGGVPAVRIRQKWAEPKRRLWIKVALGEISPPRDQRTSLPRRALLWLWGKYEGARRPLRRRSHTKVVSPSFALEDDEHQCGGDIPDSRG